MDLSVVQPLGLNAKVVPEAGARYLQICLQKLQYLHGEEDHPDIAETLRALGRFFGEGGVSHSARRCGLK